MTIFTIYDGVPSLIELAELEMMVQLLQERLVHRLPPPKSVDADLVPVEVHLHPHQPIQPVLVCPEAPAQHLHRTRRIGPPHIDDPTPRSGLEVQPPSLRERPSPRGRLDAIGPVATKGDHMTVRARLQVG